MYNFAFAPPEDFFFTKVLKMHFVFDFDIISENESQTPTK